MESFKYNVFESELLFSEFTIRSTVFSPGTPLSSQNNDKSASLPQSAFAPSEGYDSVPFNVMEQQAVFVLIPLKWLKKLTVENFYYDMYGNRSK
jgi:hypothetical protein